jgi:site-specific DNA recombinase
MPHLAAAYVRGSTEDQLDTLTAQSEALARYAEYKALNLVGPHEGAIRLDTLKFPDGRTLSGTLHTRAAASCPSTRSLELGTWELETLRGDFVTVTNVEEQHVASVWCDQGVSACSTTFLERPAASAMVAHCKAMHIQHILFAKLDRGFRNALDCLFTLAELKRAGIHVHILDLQLDTSTPMGKLVIGIMANFAEWEASLRSERQRTAFDVRRRANLVCGTVPYGKRRIPGTDHLEDEPSESIWRDMILPGGEWGSLTANEAARRLNAAGAPTRKAGSKWYPATVRSIRLANPGTVTPAPELVA